MKELIILKLGGSILTFKDKSKPVFRTRVVKRIIQEIKEAREKHNFDLIIVHGTGSFGHPIAKQHKLHLGIVNKHSIFGFAKSKRQGFRLNQKLWKCFEDEDIPTIPIQTCVITKTTDGKISFMNTSIIKEFLKKNLQILIFGDEVIDTKQGIAVCSSDQLAVYLASKLKASQLLFASDVDGVYNTNPKIDNTAIKIALITKDSIKNIINSLKPHNLNDVSGEMAGKLKSLLSYGINSNTNIRIFSGLIKKRIYQSLTGKPQGTEILL